MSETESMSSQGSVASGGSGNWGTVEYDECDSAQGKNWVFTLNNYTEEDIETLAMLSWKVKYLVYGEEVAPTTGTPHLQGFVIFLSNKRKKAVCKALGGHVWCAKTKGTAWEAARYCWKDDKQFKEYGVRPVESYTKKGGETTRQQWEEMFAMAKAGDLENIPAQFRVRYYSTFARIAKDYMQPPEPLAGPCGLWIHGQTGTGKSHCVVTQHPGR